MTKGVESGGREGSSFGKQEKEAIDPPTHFRDGECGDLVLGGMC